jgi:protein arginine kinase
MTIDLSLLPDGGISWADASGPEGHIVLSTRIRLARNLQGTAFTIRARDDDRERVLHEVLAAVRSTKTLADAALFRLETLERSDRQLLYERHLISRELAALDAGAVVRPGAALVVSGPLGMMVNEEDHLRMQSLQSGLGIQGAYAVLERLDGELGSRLPFAFNPEFGYLTACPTNAGTGLRASVLIHLPGLVLTKEIAKVLQGLSQVGLTFRGLYGEGSEVVGNFFQLSNQTTLGKSAEELLDHLGRIVRQVIQYEEQAREVLQRDAPTVIADKVWRAYGLLRYARSLSLEETMNLLSGVRLGVGLNLITDLSVYTLNKLLVFTQPAHLAQRTERTLTDPDLPAIRAGYVRKLLEDDAARRQRNGPSTPEP